MHARGPQGLEQVRAAPSHALACPRMPRPHLSPLTHARVLRSVEEEIRHAGTCVHPLTGIARVWHVHGMCTGHPLGRGGDWHAAAAPRLKGTAARRRRRRRQGGGRGRRQGGGRRRRRRRVAERRRRRRQGGRQGRRRQASSCALVDARADARGPQGRPRRRPEARHRGRVGGGAQLGALQPEARGGRRLGRLEPPRDHAPQPAGGQGGRRRLQARQGLQARRRAHGAGLGLGRRHRRQRDRHRVRLFDRPLGCELQRAARGARWQPAGGGGAARPQAAKGRLGQPAGDAAAAAAEFQGRRVARAADDGLDPRWQRRGRRRRARRDGAPAPSITHGATRTDTEPHARTRSHTHGHGATHSRSAMHTASDPAAHGATPPIPARAFGAPPSPRHTRVRGAGAVPAVRAAGLALVAAAAYGRLPRDVQGQGRGRAREQGGARAARAALVDAASGVALADDDRGAALQPPLRAARPAQRPRRAAAPERAHRALAAPPPRQIDRARARARTAQARGRLRVWRLRLLLVRAEQRKGRTHAPRACDHARACILSRAWHVRMACTHAHVQVRLAAQGHHRRQDWPRAGPDRSRPPRP